MARDLTQSDLLYLRRAAREGRRLDTIAQRLGRSEAQTRRIMQRYPDWQPGRQGPAPWTKAELDYLRRRWNGACWNELLAHLPARNRRAIRDKAKALGLKGRRTDPDEDMAPATPVAPPVRRACICCGEAFLAEGPFNRLCSSCKSGEMTQGYSDYSLAVG